MPSAPGVPSPIQPFSLSSAPTTTIRLFPAASYECKRLVTRRSSPRPRAKRMSSSSALSSSRQFTNATSTENDVPRLRKDILLIFQRKRKFHRWLRSVRGHLEVFLLFVISKVVVEYSEAHRLKRSLIRKVCRGSSSRKYSLIRHCNPPTISWWGNKRV